MRDWIWIGVLGLGFGASFFFNEILLREMGPLTVSAVRLGIGALGCWVWLIATRQQVTLTHLQMRQTFIMGVIGLALPFTIFPIGQQFISGGIAGIVNALTPVMVVIMSHFWPGGERATLAKSIGVLVGFMGIVLLAMPSLDPNAENSLFGVLFVVLAPICYGFGNNYLRYLRAIPLTLMVAWSLSWAALVLCAGALMSEGVPAIHRPETYASMLFFGLVLTSASMVAIFRTIERVGATRTSTVTFIAPISALLLGATILCERIELVHIVGMSVIFAGLLLIDNSLINLLLRKVKDQPKG